MQLPQLYRRGVVRPLDDLAAIQLAAFRIDASIRVEWLPILGDDQFGEIWESGMLQRINEACNIQISDYEEIELKACDIPKALRALECPNNGSRNVVTFLDALKKLLKEAARTATNVYFVF
jgi:hypothetical protein